MNNIYSIAVCDDDASALESEARLIREAFDEQNAEHDIKTFRDPYALLRSEAEFDMAFLDIEMDGLNGIELAKSVAERNKDCFIFFITNYSVYLDSAFDVNAFRYLSKPVDKNRLSLGIATALERINEKTKILRVKNFKNKLSADINMTTIIFIENTGRRTRIVTTQYDFVAEEVFSSVKAQIEKEVNYFAMPHQSYYVNLRYVKNYTKEKVELAYSGNTYEAMMSRRRYNGFDAKMFDMAKTIR